MVVADTFEAAREAAYQGARSTYEAEKPSATLRLARRHRRGRQQGQRTRQGPAAGRRRRGRLSTRRGQTRGRIRHADPASQPDRAVHHHGCVWRDGELTIYEPSQFVYGLKNSVAQKLGIEPDKVHVVSPFVGGAFGSKAQLTPRTGAGGAGGEEAQPAGQAGRDPRPGLHHRDLSRRNAAPHPHRRAARDGKIDELPATKAGRSPRGPTPIRSPASRTARGFTASAR